jgi:peroxiredoxin
MAGVDATFGALGRGDLAPDFKLPAADREGTVELGEYRRRGPVLLTLLRGLYCPFCRRHIGLLRPACDALRESEITLLGVIIAGAERSRQYFRYFPPCFPMAASPDRTIHRAYRLPETVRTPEFLQGTEQKAAMLLEEMGVKAPTGQASATFAASDGFQMTAEDHAEWQHPLQAVGHFLIGRDGLIRWARVELTITPLPKAEELYALL